MPFRRTLVTNGSQTVYESNKLNQYTKVGATTTYSYDNNGNLTNDGTYTYEYDCENRLMAVKQGGNTVATYKYDFAGRRVEKTVSGLWLSGLVFKLPALGLLSVSAGDIMSTVKVLFRHICLLVEPTP